MSKVITHRDPRDRSSDILRRVQDGKGSGITDHGEVVAVLVPARTLPSEAAPSPGDHQGRAAPRSCSATARLRRPSRPWTTCAVIADHLVSSVLLETEPLPGPFLRGLDAPH